MYRLAGPMAFWGRFHVFSSDRDQLWGSFRLVKPGMGMSVTAMFFFFCNMDSLEGGFVSMW